jgi:ribosomal-protein-alanine N-acetyltransferase
MIVAENDICKLRYLETDDLEILAKYANNKKIAANLRDVFPHPYTLEHAIGFYHIIKNQKPETTFVIEYQGMFTGIIGLLPLAEVYRKSAEIGYWLAEPFWNKGIMSKAVKSMVCWSWENLDIVRIQTGVFANNKSSARVLEKAGFSFEGELINAIFKNGALHNEFRYSILKSDPR